VAPGNNAVNLINQILTQPRQPPPGIATPQQNNSIGAGIAGVASTYTGPSVKSYKARTKFNEWEFVFQNQQQAATPPAATQPGQTGTTPTNTPTNNTFGNSFGTDGQTTAPATGTAR
jgi:hypothetical protein